MVEISSLKDLEKWLEDKPRDWAQVIALRAGVRALPAIAPLLNELNLQSDLKNQLTLGIGRAFFISRVAARSITEIKNAITDAAYVAVDTSYAASYVAESYYVADAVYAASRVSDAAFAVYTADVALSYDVQWLEDHQAEEGASAQLLALPLWPEAENPLAKEWTSLKWALLDLDPNWLFWRDWYQALLDGTPHPGLSPSEQKEIYQTIALFEPEFWDEGAAVVNARIAELVQEVKERREEVPPPVDFDDLEDIEIEPQKPGALRFKTIEDGKIGLDHEIDHDELDLSKGARDRHSEVRYLATQLISSFDPSQPGANAAVEIVRKVERYLKALGTGPEEVNIDFLIPRGEVLRNALEILERPDDLYESPPVPPHIKEGVVNVAAAHNIYVALDPVLDTRDQARFGPDATEDLISPADGHALIEDAAREGVTDQATVDAFDAQLEITPEVPDADNRQSRRYSESVKNFMRACLSSAYHIAETIKEKGEDYKDRVSTRLKNASIWLIKKEKWLLKNFKKNPYMKATIKALVAFLKSFEKGD